MFEFKNNESYTFGNHQFIFFDDLKRCIIINRNTNLQEQVLYFHENTTQEQIHKRINQFYGEKKARIEMRLRECEASAEEYQKAITPKLCDIVLVVVQYSNKLCIEIRRLSHGGDMEKRLTELYSHTKVLKTYRMNGMSLSAEEELFRSLVSRLKPSDVIGFDANNYRVVIRNIYFDLLDSLSNVALAMSNGNVEIKTCKEA